MKLCITVVMLVVVPCVCAADITWEVAPPWLLVPGGSGQKSSQTTKGQVTEETQKQEQSQKTDSQAQRAPLVGIQKDTLPDQAPKEQRSGKVDPQISPQELWKWLIPLIGVFVTGIGVFIAYCTIQMLREVHGPYLSIGKWEFYCPPKGMVYVTCEVTNSGGTLAIICADIVRYTIKGNTPRPPVEQKVVDQMKGARIGAKLSETVRIELPLPSDMWTFVASGQIVLFVCVGITYQGRWGWPKPIFSEVTYDAEAKIFRITNDNQNTKC